MLALNTSCIGCTSRPRAAHRQRLRERRHGLATLGQAFLAPEAHLAYFPLQLRSEAPDHEADALTRVRARLTPRPERRCQLR